MNTEFDDALIPHYYYPDGQPEKGAAEGVTNQKTARRRQKNKGGGSEDGGGGDSMMRNKRKLSNEQFHKLEEAFLIQQSLESERKDALAAELSLDPYQVAVWFQNRRARLKSKQLEEDYNTLKVEHQKALEEITRLESEVFKLKEQLKEAQRSSGVSSDVPSSSTGNQERLGNAIYEPYALGLEWDHLYSI